MVKKIKFTIDAQGEVQLDVQGTVGSECEQLTEAFEERLGALARRDLKDAYYQTTQTDHETSLERHE